MAEYGINDIESLSFKDGVRERIAMYLGSADMLGVYAAVQEIISNSIDEYYMGFGDEIEIILKGNTITINDFARGVPFGIKDDGSNVLVDIYSRAHTGGKFSDKVYQSVAGLNGIGAKATCLSSLDFEVTSYREGKYARAKWHKGVLEDYTEGECLTDDHGTKVTFTPDQEVYNIQEIKIEFDALCERCKNLSYLTKGLKFNLTDATSRPHKKKVFCAENGLLDLINDNVIKPLHKTPVYLEVQEGNMSCEVALQWTQGKERSFVFTNGILNIEGGQSLTGVKIAVTNFMKKQFKNGFDGDMARTGLVYAVNCKLPNPSFANQTKTKINNPELRGLAQRVTGQALQNFQTRNSIEFNGVVEFLAKEKKAQAAAERARKQVMEATKDIEKNQRKKVFASDKLKDAEYLGEDSTLLIVEGNSAAASMAMARDEKKYGILAIRGKILNCLSHNEEKIFQNEEIKLLCSAMNITPGRYNSSKLRYGKIAICTDADSDGYHIGLLIMAALRYLAPQFLEEGRLHWLRSPLYIVKKGKTEQYYFTDEEFEAVRGKVTGDVTRAKGLGALSDVQAHNSMFTEEFQRMDRIIPDAESIILLEELMGVDVSPRREFIFSNIDFSEIKE